MSEAAAKDYLGAIEASLNSPNMILDLRIPQNQKYQQVVLDEAMSRFLAGEIDKAAAMKAIEDGWNELNDADRQGRAARRSTRRRSARSSKAALRRERSRRRDGRRGVLEQRQMASRTALSARAVTEPMTAFELRRMARSPFREDHGPAGRVDPARLRHLPADHLGLSVDCPLRAGAGRLQADLRRPVRISSGCSSARSNITSSARSARSAPLDLGRLGGRR